LQFGAIAYYLHEVSEKANTRKYNFDAFKIDLDENPEFIKTTTGQE
jgi:hypothetical protein